MGRIRSPLRLSLALLLAGGLVAAPVAASVAADEVPDRVAGYVADGLIDRLRELYGVKDGRGIDFDDTTELGEVQRVSVFTEAFLANTASTPIATIANEWVVPVSVAEETIGLAVVWINPSLDRVELAEFLDADLADAVAELDEGSVVVRDPPRGAWLALSGETLRVLEAGTTGLSGELNAADYPVHTTPPPAGEERPAVDGGPTAMLAVIGLVVVLALLVLWPLRRRPRSAPEPLAPDAPDDD